MTMKSDMQDLAFGLMVTSRLGCQIRMSRKLDGIRLALPAMTRNLQANDFEKYNFFGFPVHNDT